MTLRQRLERLACRLFGHRWRHVRPRDDDSMAALFYRGFKWCHRCGKLDR